MGRVIHSYSVIVTDTVIDPITPDEVIMEEIDAAVIDAEIINVLIQEQMANELFIDSDSDDDDEDDEEDVEDDDDDDDYGDNDNEWIPISATLTPIMHAFFSNHSDENHSLYLEELQEMISILENFININIEFFDDDEDCPDFVHLDMDKYGVYESEWDALELEIESFLDDDSSDEEDDD